MADRGQMERYVPFVERIANKVYRRIEPPLERADLVSYGMLGLAEALDKYDPQSKVPFESFAHYRVRGAIFEGISRHCPISRHVHRRLGLDRKASDYMEGLSRDLGGTEERTPARDATLLAGAVRDLASIYAVTRLVRRRQGGGETGEFEDPTAGDQHEKSVQDSQLRGFVDRLPENQRELVRLYYFEDLTLEQVGQKLGFRKSWACKLHATALRNLRTMMEPGSGDPD